MLKLKDISLGMRVRPEELWHIYGTVIILTNFDEKKETAEIVYIGEPNTDELIALEEQIRLEKKAMCCVYLVPEEEDNLVCNTKIE